MELCLVPQAQVELSPALPHRRLHRLLHRHPPRAHAVGKTVPARQPAAAELSSGCRSATTAARPVDRASAASASSGRWGQTDAGPAPCAAGLRPLPAPGPRAGAGRFLMGPGQRARCEPKTMAIRPRTRLVRPGAAERLVGARHPGLGVPAAGPVPGQELCQFDLTVDRDDGGAGAVPPPVHAARRRPAAAALTSTVPSTARPAPSTSRWRCGCKPPRCAPPAWLPCACRSRT